MVVTSEPSLSVISIETFAKMVNASPDELPEECKATLRQCDFRFEEVGIDEYTTSVLETLKRLEYDGLAVAGSHRKSVWEKGWSENLDAFVASGYELDALLPKYFKPWTYLRFQRRYIKPVDTQFQVNFLTAVRQWLFHHYLADAQTIYEFGCGTGLNLVMLAQMFPDKTLHGLDWTAASQKILQLIAQHHGWPLHGRSFDLFAPDSRVRLAPRSAVFTIHSLEQLGGRHGPLISYWLEQAPAICVHIEPVLELYDPDHLLDYLAIQYHRKRGYLENFLTTLRQLEQEGRADILRVHRCGFGDFFNEGYSIVVWRPTQQAGS